MSLVLISLDEIKQVSEIAGHAGSDEMLRQLANLIGARVRDTDVLASMGYDEFAVLLHACPNEMATRIAMQIRDSVMGFCFEWNGENHRVGVHIGVVHLADQSQTECVNAAYAACHEAGSHGVGTVVVHGQGLLVGGM
jgi:diguanylate cyclase (GGDEF)-like protein